MKERIIEILQRTTPQTRQDIDQMDCSDEYKDLLTFDEAAELITKLFEK